MGYNMKLNLACGFEKTVRSVLVAVLVLVSAANAADVRLAWDLPTTNTDGSALVDLVAFEVDAVRYSATATIVSNVVVSLTFSPLSTNTTTFPARTNAPVGVISQTNTLTGMTAGIYEYRCRAVAALDAESADSNSITNRVGTPGTVVLKYIK